LPTASVAPNELSGTVVNLTGGISHGCGELIALRVSVDVVAGEFPVAAVDRRRGQRGYVRVERR
jgi:hypothetical protein